MEFNELIIPDVYQDLYVVGDIHGEFKTLSYNICVKHEIKDSVVCIAGDCGLGFDKPGYYENLWNDLKPRLEKNNILILCIRGNHDDPDYYNGDKALSFERLKTISDYTTLRMLDREILCVGGAVSTDRSWRLEENRKGARKVWWPNEAPIELTDRELSKLHGRVYGVISHDAPISFEPVLVRDSEFIESDEMFYDILRSREYLEKVLWKANPKRWYYGHHHRSYSGGNGRTHWRGLGIQELIRVPLEESDDNDEKKTGNNNLSRP